MLDDIAKPALGKQEHLIRVGALADLLRDPRRDRPPKDRKTLDQGLERNTLLRVAPRVLAGLRVVLGPGQIRVRPKGPEQRPEEVGRHRDQLVARPVLVPLEQLGLDRRDGLGGDHPALGGVRGKTVRNLSQQIARSLRHIGAL